MPMMCKITRQVQLYQGAIEALTSFWKQMQFTPDRAVFVKRGLLSFLATVTCTCTLLTSKCSDIKEQDKLHVHWGHVSQKQEKEGDPRFQTGQLHEHCHVNNSSLSST